jgi:GT2 family glycosyltransferase
MENIAVLLTCHNRKEKTIECLKSLYKAYESSNYNISLDIYLVDDGSTDGTSGEIHKQFPAVIIIKGSGNLFWARGMKLAWETALSLNRDYDSFLLLNDDVILSENFIGLLLQTHEFCLKNKNRSGIYVCSTMNPVNSKISYGGKLIIKKGIKVNSIRIKSSDIPVSCSMANANILMVTMEVVKAIGILDSKYVHQFADYDYTLAASNKGIPVLVCPGIGGYCTYDHGNNWLSSGSSLRDRIKFLYSPKGLGYREQIYYLKKNFKYQFPYYFTMLWLKTLFPCVWDKYKKNHY